MQELSESSTPNNHTKVAEGGRLFLQVIIIINGDDNDGSGDDGGDNKIPSSQCRQV